MSFRLNHVRDARVILERAMVSPDVSPALRDFAAQELITLRRRREASAVAERRVVTLLIRDIHTRTL